MTMLDQPLRSRCPNCRAESNVSLMYDRAGPRIEGLNHVIGLAEASGQTNTNRFPYVANDLPPRRILIGEDFVIIRGIRTTYKCS